MNTSSFFVFTLLLSLVIGGAFLTMGCASSNKKQGISIYMAYGQNQHKVLESRHPKGKKIEKIVFNRRDLTSFLSELFNLDSLTFTSSRLLIFEGDKVVYQSDEWRCESGKIFVPGQSKVLVIKAMDIRYNEKDEMLTGKNAEIRKISFGVEKTEQRETVPNLRIALDSWE